ncbi:MAG: hypothetical protein WDO15_17850 [Bacteroidota bacterium]
MSYRPDESILISWLYGELDEAEKAKVEKYFQENPDELKKMQQLSGVKDIMSSVQDKEVIAPPLFMDDDVKVVSFWRTTSFKTVMSIAASFLLLIVAAKLLNMDVNYSNSELRISFGTPAKQQIEPSLSATDVQRMIDESNSKNREALDVAIKESFNSNATKINELVRQASVASKTDIQNFVSSLQRDNLTQVRDYLQLSAADQHKYTDNLVLEFSKYLQEQRNQDLNMFQTRFSKLEQHTDELKTETEQILASIISNSPQQGQQSSY